MESLPEFRNEPYTDFSVPANRRAMKAALRNVKAQFGREYELRIGGECFRTGDPLKSLNPSNVREVVGVHHKATPDLAARAVETAYDYFPEWRATPAEDRVRRLLRAAAILRERKMEFDAWLVYEAGKTWPEAEADVSEAIDFCEYYAREMLRLSGPQPVVQLSGERDEMRYLPLGAGVVIPPWNFPLAILCGMTVAALVTGNTVVLKPSSETPTIAVKFGEVLLEAGFPERGFSVVTGSGSAIGDLLVQHPKVRFVAFTGSRDVGLRINELAAKPQPGQIWIKRVVAEMGGKDAIIVDADADLDKAVEGVLASAFGYQGQKCSACSRAIVDAKVYEPFLAKLKERASALKVGPADDPANYMGPVISEGAQRAIREYIETGKREGRPVLDAAASARRRMVRRAHGHRRRRPQSPHLSGGDLRSRPRGEQGAGFRTRAGACQRLAVRPDRRHLLEQPGARARGPRAFLRRQPLREPQVHGRHGRGASVRRLQHVGDGFESRRAGLPAAVHASPVHRRKGVVGQALGLRRPLRPPYRNVRNSGPRRCSTPLKLNSIVPSPRTRMIETAELCITPARRIRFPFTPSAFPIQMAMGVADVNTATARPSGCGANGALALSTRARNSAQDSTLAVNRPSIHAITDAISQGDQE